MNEFRDHRSRKTFLKNALEVFKNIKEEKKRGYKTLKTKIKLLKLKKEKK